MQWDITHTELILVGCCFNLHFGLCIRDRASQWPCLAMSWPFQKNIKLKYRHYLSRDGVVVALNPIGHVFNMTHVFPLVPGHVLLFGRQMNVCLG